MHGLPEVHDGRYIWNGMLLPVVIPHKVRDNLKIGFDCIGYC
jgi:hypothetical protein